MYLWCCGSLNIEGFCVVGFHKLHKPVIRAYSLHIPCFRSHIPPCLLPIPECQCEMKGTLSGVGECEQVRVFICTDPITFTPVWLHCIDVNILKPYRYKMFVNSFFLVADLFVQRSGQCHCKPNACGHTCDSCKDGFFRLQKKNYLGCQGKTLFLRR